jgi:hypothetical protein
MTVCHERYKRAAGKVEYTLFHFRLNSYTWPAELTHLLNAAVAWKWVEPQTPANTIRNRLEDGCNVTVLENSHLSPGQRRNGFQCDYVDWDKG